MTWLLDAWYVACTPDEIAAGPLGRQICGEHMVFFRSDTAVAALEDFCPHRGAPLSLGTVRDGMLVCGYHGLTMSGTGCAATMPGQRATHFPAIRSFPAIERYGFIWVWPGNPSLADGSGPHHLPWANNDDWAYGGGRYQIECDYRLMIDNLMDLSHETYVHATSIGQPEIDEAPVSTRANHDEVITSRFMTSVSAPPFWQMALRGAGLDSEATVDRWQICRFTLPSHVMIEVGVALAGHGGYDAPDDCKASSIVVDFMTPRTATSHHYFWGMARRFATKDAGLTERIREGQNKIFSEDVEMLERQQLNLTRNPDRNLLKLNIDAGGVRSRMMIDRAIACSAGAAGANAAPRSDT